MEESGLQKLKRILSENNNGAIFLIPGKFLMSVTYTPQETSPKHWEYWISIFFKESRRGTYPSTTRFHKYFQESCGSDSDDFHEAAPGNIYWTEHFRKLLPEMLENGKLVSSSYVRRLYSEIICDALHRVYQHKKSLIPKDIERINTFLNVLGDPDFDACRYFRSGPDYNEAMSILGNVWEYIESLNIPLSDLEIHI